MRYLGGKTRIAKQLASIIDLVREPGQWVWDPFCGGLSMSVALSKNGPVWSTDVNAALIALYKAVQQGWQPPTEVSKERYEAAKALPDSDPMKAFCGFGCSFGGTWFGSFAEGLNGPLTYAQLAARNVIREVKCLTAFDHINFNAIEPAPTDAVIYCDPTYRGTAGYKAVGKFDHDLFRRRVLSWSEHTHVFISEYAFNAGAEVWSRTSKGTFGLKSGKVHTERLFWLPKGGRP